MRFLRAERIETAALFLDDNRVRLRIGPEPPVRAETGREAIPGGHGVVKPRQAEIFIHRPPGSAVIEGGAGGQAVLKQLGAILRRPVPHKRQYARHQIRRRNIGAGVRAGRCRIGRIGNVAGNQALPGLRAGYNGGGFVVSALPERFISSEDEHFVPAKGTAQRPAKLVSLERRSALGGSEEWTGVKFVIAQVLEGAAVPLVGPRSGDDSDLSARSLTIFGAIGVAEDVVF